MNAGRRDRLVWGVTLAIWFVGIWLLLKLWELGPLSSKDLDSLFSVTLYGVAFFYCFAIGPIRTVVSHALARWSNRHK